MEPNKSYDLDVSYYEHLQETRQACSSHTSRIRILWILKLFNIQEFYSRFKTTYWILFSNSAV